MENKLHRVQKKRGNHTDKGWTDEFFLRSGKFTNPELSPRPILIFLDLNMPKKDGYHSLVQIKADPDLEGIPVAIWTTSGEKDDKIRCQKAGADFLLTKPFG